MKRAEKLAADLLAWERIVLTVAHGQPVFIADYAVNRAWEWIGKVQAALANAARQLPDLEVKIGKRDGGVYLTPRKWVLAKPSPDQLAQLQSLAEGNVSAIYLRGLAPIDIEDDLQKLSESHRCKLTAEYAVQHLPGGLTDRACHVFREVAT